MKNGFDVDECSEDGHGLGDTTASVEILEILNGELVTDMKLVVLNPFGNLFEALVP